MTRKLDPELRAMVVEPIVEAKAARGLRVSDLCRVAGISKASWYSFSKGLCLLRVDALMLMAHHCGVSLDEIAARWSEKHNE